MSLLHKMREVIRKRDGVYRVWDGW
jgi:hypothetical protein